MRPCASSGSSSERGTTLESIRALKMLNEGDLTKGMAGEMKCPRCFEKRQDHDVSHSPTCWTMRPWHVFT